MSVEKVLANLEANWPEVVTPYSKASLAAFRLATLLRANATAALRPFGLGFTEFELLCALRASPPPHELLPSELYDAMLISSGGLTKVLKALEARGLVDRPSRGGDGRRRPCALSPAGAALAQEAMAAVQAVDRALFEASGVSEAEFETVFRDLCRAAAPFEAEA